MKAREIACSVLLTLPAFVACQSGLGTGPLDGRVYRVTLAGPRETTPDNLVFDGGRFESTVCRGHGFTTSPYSARTDGGASLFEASAKSSQAGTTAWSGRIEGDAIRGTMVQTDPKGAQVEYRFDGRALSGPLDGKVFAGELCEGNSTSGDEDRLLFRNGCFDSEACRAYGFTMAPYSIAAASGGTSFHAEAINGDGERNCWDGVLVGDEIRGTMEHKNPAGKTTDSFRFVAKLTK